MGPVARGLADVFRVIEPFQRGSGSEPLTVARHVADLHEVIAACSKDCRPALLGSSWGAMLALAYAAAHPTSTGPLVLVGCGTFDPVTRAAMQSTIAERMSGEIHARLKYAEELDPGERLKAMRKLRRQSIPTIYWPLHRRKTRLTRERMRRRGTTCCACRLKAFTLHHSQRSKSLS